MTFPTVAPDDWPMRASSAMYALVEPPSVTTAIEAPAETKPTVTFGVRASTSISLSAFICSAAPCCRRAGFVLVLAT